MKPGTQKVIDFLEEILKGREALLPTMPYYHGCYVKEWDEVNYCGTVCCMEGAIPAIRPDLAKWVLNPWVLNPYNYAGVKTLDGEDFIPFRCGIPMDTELWRYLTSWEFDLDGTNLTLNNNLGLNATFPEVKAVWLDVIELLKRGELQEYVLE